MTDSKHIIPRDPAFLAFVITKPCRVCGKTPVVAAHGPGRKGTSVKTSDYTALPLCFDCHDEQHQIGAKSFAEKHDLNYYEESFRLLHEYQTGELV